MPTCNLKFCAVLTPKTNAMVAGWDINPAVKFKDTRSKVLGAGTYFGIRLPDVPVLPTLGDWVPGSRAQTLAIRVILEALFKDVVKSTRLRGVRREQRFVGKPPVTVDRRAAFGLGAGERDGVRLSRGRWCRYILDRGCNLGSGHGWERCRLRGG
jgi:hypothetical protein